MNATKKNKPNKPTPTPICYPKAEQVIALMRDLCDRYNLVGSTSVTRCRHEVSPGNHETTAGVQIGATTDYGCDDLSAVEARALALIRSEFDGGKPTNVYDFPAGDHRGEAEVHVHGRVRGLEVCVVMRAAAWRKAQAGGAS